MKILQVIHGIDKNSGGASTYLKLLVEQLTQYCEAEIAAIDSGNNIELDSKVKCHYFKTDLITSFGYSKQLSSFINKFQADVYHGNGLWQFPVHSMSMIARKKKTPYLISTHGMLEPWSMKQGSLKKKLFYKLFQQKDITSANVIHATSKMEADTLKLMDFRNPIAIIPNGIDTKEFVPAARNKNSDFKTLLFLSRIHPKKGIEMLIDIWKEIDLSKRKEWRVAIAGNGEGDYTNTLNERIRSFGLENQIQLLGSFWGKEKVKLYQEADLFILPTYSENFGIVVAEALACGVPVITTKGAPWQDLQTFGCGWWTDIEEKSIKIALEDALSLSAEELREMGNKGRKLVEEKFSIKRTAEDMIKVYEWMLQRKAKPDFVI